MFHMVIAERAEPHVAFRSDGHAGAAGAGAIGFLWQEILVIPHC
jgi:hypothetical protein